MAKKTEYIETEAKLITSEMKKIVSGLQFFQNKRTVEHLSYPVASDLYDELTAINKLMPNAIDNVAWRKETSVRQSFSRVRSKAIDESEHTVVGRKKDEKRK